MSESSIRLMLMFCWLYNTYGNTIWSSAIRLRNGDQYYISNETQQIVINYNVYLFQDFNLFYFSQQTQTTTFINNIPTHTPKALCLVPNSIDGIDEGNTLLVMLSTCIVSFNLRIDAYAKNISIEAGHCYESGKRDGPNEFSRFNALGALAASRNNIWVVSDNVVNGSRLCLVQNNNVITWGSVWNYIRALSISFVEKNDEQQGELFVAVCWRKGSLSIMWIPSYSSSIQDITEDRYTTLQSTYTNSIFAQIVVNSITLMLKEKEGKRILYLFNTENASKISKQQIEWRENSTFFEIVDYKALQVVGEVTGLYVDFPYGVFIADGYGKQFHKVDIMGCVCPPGYGLVDNSGHCQMAPLGGYVDVLGNFIPCPAGTFSDSISSTSSKVCVPCPPYQISKYPQSIKCTMCFSGGKLLPHNPTRTQCAIDCPIGSYLDSKGGACITCEAGSSISVYGNCELCTENTYSNPSSGILKCTACPYGKVSGIGASACSLVCTSGCAPKGDGICMPTTRKDILLTISVLGIKPMAAAMAKNGTVYLVGFQTVIVIDKSGGGSVSLQFGELSLVRDICLSQDEGLLFVAVSTYEILCFSFIGTSYTTWTRLPLLPESCSIVGIASSNEILLLHDMTTNSIYNHSKEGISIVYRGNSLILSMLFTPQVLYVLEQDSYNNNMSITMITKNSIVDVLTFDNGIMLNPHMAFWQDRLILSIGHSIAWIEKNRSIKTLIGFVNISGRIDNIGGLARLTNPGPILVTDAYGMLIVDDNGLRMMYAMGDRCQCDRDYYLLDGKACVPCPQGMFSMPGTRDRCSNCKRGQYYDPKGECTPCPKMAWWNDDNSGCPNVMDTIVGRDSTGLSLQDILMEMSDGNPQFHEFMDIMKDYDYLCVHTLQLPLKIDSISVDALAEGRFWQRTNRNRINEGLSIELPGFWIVCGTYVLQTQACTCTLPEGGITEMYQWNEVKKKASRIDYDTLNISFPIGINNISISPSAIFVSRTDSIYDSLVYVDSVFRQRDIRIPALQSGESSFATCIAGWPVTFTCEAGFLWIAPLQKCIPCKAGFYHTKGQCIACPIGSFATQQGSTTCMECPSARDVASIECRLVNITGEICTSGFFKAGTQCRPCPPGSYSSTLNASSCIKCSNDTVSSQWGSTICTTCPIGYTSSSSDRCIECNSDLYYFAYDTKHMPMCINKTVLECPRGYYLQDGHAFADNQCIQCAACTNEEIMIPYNGHPCNYDVTRNVGAPYKCVLVKSLPGLFARLSIHLSDIYNFSIRYTPCDGLPAFASWTQGSDPTFCYFKCDYAISESAAIQYAYYFSSYILKPKDNVFTLEYPSQSIHINALSKDICLPCPKTQCDWGKFRRITDSVHGCGLPTCTTNSKACQVVPGGIVTVYNEDGCNSNCTIPENSYVAELSLPGTDDNCGWKCKLGFYQDEFQKCSLCTSTVCEKGQIFIATTCLPDKKKEDFCLPCPMDSRGLANLSLETSTRGICEYNCIAGTYLSDPNTKPPVCISCSRNVFCPSGFRRVCSVETCVACPSLPISLWGSAVKMPSNQDSCKVSCRSGYHTIDLITGQVINSAISYNVNSIACILCSLRPTVACTSSTNLCTSGYYMPLPGSGICKPCPTVYTCGAGFTPSSCVCTLCKMHIVNAMFVTQQAADAVVGVMDSGTCPSVCIHNTVLVSGECIPCNTLLHDGVIYYSVWNASKGTRWWDESKDPQHLPIRTLGEEKRAGLCWPCPEGFTTLIGDTDLCTSTLIVSKNIIEEKANVINITNIIMTASQGGFFSMFSFLFSKNKTRHNTRRLLFLPLPDKLVHHKGIKIGRRVNNQPHSELLYACSSFAYLDNNNVCVCRKGFHLKGKNCVIIRSEQCEKGCTHGKHKDEHGNCRLCPFQQIYNITTKKCNGVWTKCIDTEYMDLSSGRCKKCPGNSIPMHAFNYAEYEVRDCVCPKGSQYDKAVCKTCPRGTYSSFMGHSPCITCPDEMTTLRDGAFSVRECVQDGLINDVLFVDHRAEEFYKKKSYALGKTHEKYV